jgi:hypothetical protein
VGRISGIEPCRSKSTVWKRKILYIQTVLKSAVGNLINLVTIRNTFNLCYADKVQLPNILAQSGRGDKSLDVAWQEHFYARICSHGSVSLCGSYSSLQLRGIQLWCTWFPTSLLWSIQYAFCVCFRRTAIPRQPRGLRPWKIPRFARPRPYRKLGVTGSAYALNIHHRLLLH